MSRKISKKDNTQKNNLFNYLPKKTDLLYMQLASPDVQKYRKSSVSDATSSENQAATVSDENYIKSQEKIAALELKCAKLEEENKKLLYDNKCLKKLLNASKDLNLYNGLQLKMQKEKTSETVEKMLFIKHESNFTPTQLKELRSISTGKSKDTKLISIAMESFYEDRVAQKCVSKRSDDDGKHVITPEKKDIMKEMLEERVTAEGVAQSVVIERCDRLNRLIGDAVYNHQRKLKNSSKTPVQREPVDSNQTKN